MYNTQHTIYDNHTINVQRIESTRVNRSGRIVDDDVDLVVRVGLQIRLDHHAVPAF
jgi:hypothetical protein